MPFLRLYAPEGQLKAQWPVGDAPLTLGRAGTNDIVLEDPGISKRHARIEAVGQDHVLVDAGSANGVFVNGARISRHTLSFWDEIRIYPYKLVYMARATLPGEELGAALQDEPARPPGATIMMPAANVAALIRRQQQPRIAYLTRADSGARLLVERDGFSFGRSRECNLRCGGWLAPALAASIEHRADGCYLVPGRRGRVKVNGERLREPLRLSDDTQLEVQRVALTYYYRALDE